VRTRKEILILTAASFLATLVIWLPFIFKINGNMNTVFKNFDGPNYIIVAKSWYDKAYIGKNFSLPTPLEYYPAHLPGYPLTISFLNAFFPGPWAMLLSTIIFTLCSSVAFFLLLKKFKLSENPLWLSLVFLVLPARWLAVKAVGSPEPLFLFALLGSFYFFKSCFTENRFKNLFLAGALCALAQITKSPGILLFAGYEIYFLIKLKQEPLRKGFLLDFYQQVVKPSLPLLLIPLSALMVFLFYRLQTNDFFAYFHSGDNFHLVFPPYQALSQGRNWLGDFWREDMIWQYLLGALAIIFLVKQKLYDLASFAGVFFAATLFVAHRDLARYSLPLVPFALIAFDKFIQKKEFKIALLIILPAIYLYAVNFIAGNTAPIADWTPYL